MRTRLRISGPTKAKSDREKYVTQNFKIVVYTLTIIINVIKFKRTRHVARMR